MKNNGIKNVIAAIAETQDGNCLKEGNDFSDFILNRIYANNLNPPMEGFIEVEDLITDFKYMINQLQNAIKPLEAYSEKWH